MFVDQLCSYRKMVTVDFGITCYRSAPWIVKVILPIGCLKPVVADKIHKLTLSVKEEIRSDRNATICESRTNSFRICFLPLDPLIYKRCRSNETHIVEYCNSLTLIHLPPPGI